MIRVGPVVVLDHQVPPGRPLCTKTQLMRGYLLRVSDGTRTHDRLDHNEIEWSGSPTYSGICRVFLLWVFSVRLTLVPS